MASTIRRVVRVLIYEGTPEWVEATLALIAIPDGSIKGFLPGCLIRATRVEDVLISTDTAGQLTVTTFEEPRR